MEIEMASADLNHSTHGCIELEKISWKENPYVFLLLPSNQGRKEPNWNHFAEKKANNIIHTGYYITNDLSSMRATDQNG
jgi:hypothetical protein